MGSGTTFMTLQILFKGIILIFGRSFYKPEKRKRYSNAHI